MEHTKRAVYQGGHVWGQTLECFQCIPSPENLGWQNEKENSNWKPKWTTSTAVAASCQELLKCGCKKSNCVGNCKSYRAGLSCTGLCTCNCQIDWTQKSIMMQIECPKYEFDEKNKKKNIKITL